MSPPLPLTSSCRKGKNEFNPHKYLLSACYVPSTLLGTRDKEQMGGRGQKHLHSWSLHSGGMPYSVLLESGLQEPADQALALPSPSRRTYLSCRRGEGSLTGRIHGCLQIFAVPLPYTLASVWSLMRGT